MSMQSRLSLIGLFNWDNDLFNEMVFPDDWDSDTKDILIANILLECGDLEVIYSDWDFLKTSIGAWSAKEIVTWNRLYQAMLIEYDPIQNYNRVEKTNTQNSGALTNSGYDSDVSSGTDTLTNSITSFDSNTYAPHDKSEQGHGTTVTHNHGLTTTDSRGALIQSEISGNIGVTTSQQMLESELELVPKLNVMNYIIDSFRNRFCLLVY